MNYDFIDFVLFSIYYFISNYEVFMCSKDRFHFEKVFEKHKKWHL